MGGPCPMAEPIMPDTPPRSEPEAEEPDGTAPHIGPPQEAHSAPAGRSASEEASLGWVSGRYEILGEIARGGMGIVFRAIDHAFDREIAVKAVRRKFAGSAVAARFLPEAKITGRLQHPGIPP